MSLYPQVSKFAETKPEVNLTGWTTNLLLKEEVGA